MSQHGPFRSGSLIRVDRHRFQLIRGRSYGHRLFLFTVAGPALVIMLLLLFLAGCAGGGGTPPQQNPPPTPTPTPVPTPSLARIAFSSHRALDGSNAVNANSNIWLVDGDGSGPTPLTRLTAAESFGPVWSPNGSKIAFFSSSALNGGDVANVHNIWVMNADGSGATPLTRLTAAGADSEFEVWSPDGSKIAFESSRSLDGSDRPITNFTSNIWVMNSDGSGAMPLTKVTAVGADCRSAAWSPDSSKIAFISARALDGGDARTPNDVHNVWVVNADGSGTTPLTRLTAIRVDSFSASWSPNGSRLAFSSSRALDGSDAPTTNNTANIWLMNADGSSPTPLTRLTAAIQSEGPAWSPDGTRLTYQSRRDLNGGDFRDTNGFFNVWVTNADGSGDRPLTRLDNADSFTSSASSNGFIIGTTWSLDGRQIAFFSTRALDGSDALDANAPGVLNLWIINSDGTGVTPLTRLTVVGADSVFPTWQPH